MLDNLIVAFASHTERRDQPFVLKTIASALAQYFLQAQSRWETPVRSLLFSTTSQDNKAPSQFLEPDIFWQGLQSFAIRSMVSIMWFVVELIEEVIETSSMGLMG